MKKLLMFLAAGMMASCATASISKSKYPNLEFKNIENICEPAEFYRVQVMPMPLLVLHFDKCAGVNNLVLVIAPLEAWDEETRLLSVRLVSIHYTDYLNRERSEGGSLAWSLKLVERETQSTEERKQEIFYYVALSHSTSINKGDQ
jgi:hypothetical protein